MEKQVFEKLHQAVTNYAGVGITDLQATSNDTATFTDLQQKYAVVVVNVVGNLSLKTKITPTLPLWHKATANKHAKGATPLICAIGSNGVSIISEVSRYHDAFYPTAGDDINHILVGNDGELSVIACYNEGGRKDD